MINAPENDTRPDAMEKLGRAARKAQEQMANLEFEMLRVSPITQKQYEQMTSEQQTAWVKEATDLLQKEATESGQERSYYYHTADGIRKVLTFSPQKELQAEKDKPSFAEQIRLHAKKLFKKQRGVNEIQKG